MPGHPPAVSLRHGPAVRRRRPSRSRGERDGGQAPPRPGTPPAWPYPVLCATGAVEPAVWLCVHVGLRHPALAGHEPRYGLEAGVTRAAVYRKSFFAGDVLARARQARPSRGTRRLSVRCPPGPLAEGRKRDRGFGLTSGQEANRPLTWPFAVRRQGLEPRTRGLRACSRAAKVRKDAGGSGVRCRPVASSIALPMSWWDRKGTKDAVRVWRRRRDRQCVARCSTSRRPAC